jgi:hypothetical protein
MQHHLICTVLSSQKEEYDSIVGKATHVWHHNGLKITWHSKTCSNESVLDANNKKVSQLSEREQIHSKGEVSLAFLAGNPEQELVVLLVPFEAIILGDVGEPQAWDAGKCSQITRNIFASSTVSDEF